MPDWTRNYVLGLLPGMYRDLIDFRESSKVETSREELVKLAHSVLDQEPGLKRDVAEVVFEERCLECFTMMCEELKSVGYTELLVSDLLIAAKPKLEPGWAAPLWSIVDKYFPVATSRGSWLDANFVSVTIDFPKQLVGKHILTTTEKENK